MQKILMSEVVKDNKQVKTWTCINKHSGRLEEMFQWAVWSQGGMTFQRATAVSCIDYRLSFRYGHRFYVAKMRLVRDETSVLVQTPEESRWIKVKGFNYITNE